MMMVKTTQRGATRLRGTLLGFLDGTSDIAKAAGSAGVLDVVSTKAAVDLGLGE
jgi:hypothetical protein